MALSEEKSPEDLRSVWGKYGLRESPLTTSPARLVGILPIEKVFSGRKEEVERLKGIIISSNSSRTLIVGDFGVGKTTYVNYLRWKLCIKEKSKYLTTPSEIKMHPSWDAMQFLHSTLSAVYSASIIFNWEKNGVKLRSIKEIGEYVSISSSRNFQGSIGGLGGGYGESKNFPPSISPEILEGLLHNFCTELREHKKEIILVYDNIENLEFNKLSDFLRSIKEYVQIEGMHSLFLGPTGTISAFERYPQVHSIFSPHIILNQMNAENVIEILKKRCEVLKIEEGSYIPPYDAETVKKLYLSLGNIRFTFKVLEDATINYEKNAPCKITMNEIIGIQEKEKKEIFSKLNEQQTRIISVLMDHESLNMTKLSSLTKIGTTNMRNPLKSLEEKGLVTITSNDDDRRIKIVRVSDNSYLKLIFASENIKK